VLTFHYDTMKCAVSVCCYFLRHSNALCVTYIYFKTASIKMLHSISSFSSMLYDTVKFLHFYTTTKCIQSMKITNKGTEAICHFKATASLEIECSVLSGFAILYPANLVRHFQSTRNIYRCMASTGFF